MSTSKTPTTSRDSGSSLDPDDGPLHHEHREASSVTAESPQLSADVLHARGMSDEDLGPVNELDHQSSRGHQSTSSRMAIDTPEQMDSGHDSDRYASEMQTIFSLQSRIASLTASLASKESVINDLTSKYDQLSQTSQVQDLEKRRLARLTSSQEHDLTTLRQDNDRLLQLIARQEQNLDQLQQDYLTRIEKAQQLQDQYRKASLRSFDHEHGDDMEKTYALLRARVGLLEARLKERSEFIDNLMHRLESSTNEYKITITALNDEIAAEKSLNYRLRQQLNEHERCRKSHEQSLKECTAQIEQLNARCERFQTQTTLLRAELRKSSDQEQFLTARVTHLEYENKELLTSEQTCRMELASLRTKNSELEYQQDHLSRTFQTAQQLEQETRIRLKRYEDLEKARITSKDLDVIMDQLSNAIAHRGEHGSSSDYDANNNHQHGSHAKTIYKISPTVHVLDNGCIRIGSANSFVDMSIPALYDMHVNRSRELERAKQQIDHLSHENNNLQQQMSSNVHDLQQQLEALKKQHQTEIDAMKQHYITLMTEKDKEIRLITTDRNQITTQLQAVLKRRGGTTNMNATSMNASMMSMQQHHDRSKSAFGFASTSSMGDAIQSASDMTFSTPEELQVVNSKLRNEVNTYVLDLSAKNALIQQITADKTQLTEQLSVIPTLQTKVEQLQHDIDASQQVITCYADLTGLPPHTAQEMVKLRHQHTHPNQSHGNSMTSPSPSSPSMTSPLTTPLFAPLQQSTATTHDQLQDLIAQNLFGYLPLMNSNTAAAMGHNDDNDGMVSPESSVAPNPADGSQIDPVVSSILIPYLTSKIASHESRLRDMQAALTTCNDNLTQAQNQCVGVNLQLGELTQQHTALTTEHERLQKEFDQQSIQFAVLQGKSEDFNQILADKKAELDRSEERCKQLKQDYDTVMQQYNQLSIQHQVLETQAKLHDMQLASQQTIAATAQAEASHLRQELDTVTQQERLNVQELHTNTITLTKRIESLENQKADLLATTEKLQEQLKLQQHEFHQQLQQYQQHLLQSTSMMSTDELGSQLNLSLVGAGNVSMVGSTMPAAPFTGVHAHQPVSVDDTAPSLQPPPGSVLGAGLGAKSVNVSFLGSSMGLGGGLNTSTMTATPADYLSLREQLRQLRQESQQAHARLKDAQDQHRSEVGQLHSQQLSLERDLFAKQQQLYESQVEITSLKQCIKQLEEKVRAIVTAKLHRAGANTATARISPAVATPAASVLGVDQGSASSPTTTVEIDINQLENLLETSGKVKPLENELTMLQTELSSVQSMLDTSNTTVEQLNTRIGELTLLVEEKDAVLEKNTAEITALTASLDAKTALYDAKVDELLSLQKTYEEQSVELGTLKEQLDELQMKLTVSELDHKHALTTLSMTQKNYELLVMEQKSLSETALEHTKTIQGLNDAKTKLEQIISENEKESAALRVEYNQLKQSHQQLRIEKEEMARKMLQAPATTNAIPTTAAPGSLATPMKTKNPGDSAARSRARASLMGSATTSTSGMADNDDEDDSRRADNVTILYLRQQNEELTSRLQQLTLLTERTKEQVETRQDDVLSLQTKLTALGKELHSERVQYQELLREHRKVTEDLVALQTEQQRQQDDKEQVAAVAAAGATAALQQECSECVKIKAQVQAKEKTLQLWETRYLNLQSQHRTLLRTKYIAGEECVCTKLADYSARLEQLVQHEKDLETFLVDADREILLMTGQIETLTTTMTTIRNEIATQNTDVGLDLGLLETMITTLIAKNDKLVADFTQLSASRQPAK